VVLLNVTIIAYLGDDPQPGIVECRLVDVFGRGHRFIDKTAVVTDDLLDEHSTYPRPGVIACRILGSRVDHELGEVVLIDTSEPWAVDSVERLSRFEVRWAQLSIDEG
jgi:hypothetical protein